MLGSEFKSRTMSFQSMIFYPPCYNFVCTSLWRKTGNCFAGSKERHLTLRQQMFKRHWVVRFHSITKYRLFEWNWSVKHLGKVVKNETEKTLSSWMTFLGIGERIEDDNSNFLFWKLEWTVTSLSKNNLKWKKSRKRWKWLQFGAWYLWDLLRHPWKYLWLWSTYSFQKKI